MPGGYAARAGIVLAFFTLARGAGALGAAQPDTSFSQDVPREEASSGAGGSGPPAIELNLLTPAIHANSAPSRGEQVMRALAKAHPKRIQDLAYIDGDWAVEMRGTWYVYAGGKLLPQSLLPAASTYSPQPFYNYPKDLPAWKPPGKEEAERLAQLSAQRRQTGQTIKRSQYFYNDLWNIHNRTEAWEQVKTIKFLGKDILAHHAILEELALIEQRVTKEARANRHVKQWLDQIHSISAWNWRTIADTQSTSNHAYGMAIDILPASTRGLETYWLWAAQKRADWWAVPYTARYHPPDAVIKIFESYGFIWGGKWLFYDTMHFEYRPEILLLNGLDINGEY